VVREEVGGGGRNDPLYAHMNKKKETALCTENSKMYEITKHYSHY
jgi:hypothetical protein